MNDQVKNRIGCVAIFILLLTLAFVQGYHTVSDLNWTCDDDFDRDMSFVQGVLDGHYGQDPNYRGEYLWYNPLLFLLEALIIKITHLPVHLVLAKAGIYLNLLAPVTFACMACVFFGRHIALAAVAGFLFFTTGNILGWGSATYSPWLYPASFMQFIFYLNLLISYKALSTQKYSWFLLLGSSLGISFLGHTAPTILMMLILVSIQSGNILKEVRSRNFRQIQKYFLQGGIVLLSFILFSFPLLFYVVGKYQLHFANRITFEYLAHFFDPSDAYVLLQKNISICFFIAVFGFIHFYIHFREKLIRRIILNWLFITAILFMYTTAIPFLDYNYHIRMPGLVPSFHFFFYLKAVQAVFFGFGCLAVFGKIIQAIDFFRKGSRTSVQLEKTISSYFLFFLLAAVLLYLPSYKSRDDFTVQHNEALKKEQDKDRVEVYDWLLKNSPPSEVILCEKEEAVFPVMATGRKMISTNITLSNPYLDFNRREEDRNNMLSFLRSAMPASAKKLFVKYDADIILLRNAELGSYTNLKSESDSILFRNATFSLFFRNEKRAPAYLVKR